MSSFGYSVLGFGTVTPVAAGLAAPSSAVIKTADGGASNAVDQQRGSARGGFTAEAIVPDDVGASGNPFVFEDLTAADEIRFDMIKTVGGGTVASHAWTAVIAKTVGTGTPEWTGTGSATDAGTSAAFTTDTVKHSTLSSLDQGTITFSYTATNATGSTNATDVVCHWVAG
tara:strand:+ start:140 stop:652 length:513 start_codon:yes stop_codon:yes gene_type:complete